MGVRSWLNDHARAATGIGAAVVVLATGLIVVQLLANRQTLPDKLPDAYFTVDDGKTYFAAGSENIPPFDYKGQKAVRAFVFECTSGKRFVGYVERYNSEAHAKLLSGKDVTPQVQMYGRELKKPGGNAWVKSGDFAAVAKVSDVKCPEGHAAEPIEP
jgi:hypothetical protein